jgi:hypothetical protein
MANQGSARQDRSTGQSAGRNHRQRKSDIQQRGTRGCAAGSVIRRAALPARGNQGRGAGEEAGSAESVRDSCSAGGDGGESSPPSEAASTVDSTATGGGAAGGGTSVRACSRRRKRRPIRPGVLACGFHPRRRTVTCIDFRPNTSASLQLHM